MQSNESTVLERPALPADDAIIMRQSTVESLTLCPARVGLSKLEGYDPTPSEPMAFGTLVHKMIETHLEGGDGALMKLLLPKGIEELFTRTIADDGYVLSELTNPSHVTAICLEAREAYQSWLKQFWMPIGRHLQVTAMEELRVKFIGYTDTGREVWVQGTPDLVHTNGLVDWKTAGRGWQDGKASTRIQSALYVFLEDIDMDKFLNGVPFEYLVYDRSKRAWKPYPIYITQQHIDSALAACLQWAAMVEAKAFPPTPSASTGKPGRGWWCSAKFCGAWNICPYKAIMPDGKDLTETRESSWT